MKPESEQSLFQQSLFLAVPVLFALTIIGPGCSLMVPPPFIAPHQGSLHPKANSSTILIAGGVAGKIVPGAGGDVRYQYQLTDNLALGAAGTFGFNIEDSDDEDEVHRLFAGRVYGRYYYPGLNKLFSFVFGAGGGSLFDDLGYFTLDSSSIFSAHTPGKVFELYIAVHVAFSHPFGGYMAHIPPGSKNIHLENTFFGGASLGFLIHFNKYLAWSIDSTAMAGTSENGAYSLSCGLLINIL